MAPVPNKVTLTGTRGEDFDMSLEGDGDIIQPVTVALGSQVDPPPLR